MQRTNKQRRPRKSKVRKAKRAKLYKKIPTQFPNEMLVTFKYVANFTVSGAGPAVTKRFVSNSVWRPEATSGTSAVPFLEYQALFAFFRVIKYRYRVTFVNNENFPIDVFVINTNEDPSVSADIKNTAQDLTQNAILSPKGGLDKKTFTKTFTVQRVVGLGRQVRSDDDYRGLMTAGSEANPADVTWLGFGANSGTGANITNGATCFVQLDYITQIYGRQLQTQAEQPVPKALEKPSTSRTGGNILFL